MNRRPRFDIAGRGSSRSSPTPHGSQPWNWHRPTQRQSRLLRSPGILSRRVLRGFLPLRRQLLDQPSQARCGTLATNSIVGSLEQRTCQTRSAHAAEALLAARAQSLAINRAKTSGLRREIAAAASPSRPGRMRSMLRNCARRTRKPFRLPAAAAAFQAGCTDSDRLLAARAISRGIGRGFRLCGARGDDLAASCVMKRFCSALLRPASVS